MLLSQEIVLPNGLRMPNRLVKAAMAEQMAPDSHEPGDQFMIAYGEWADGGWGMLLTGNVMVSEKYCGSPADLRVPTNLSQHTRDMFKAWAETCQRSGTPTVVQICHPGRQSPTGAGNRSFFTKTIAPSAIKLNLGSSLISKALVAFAFGTPRAMTLDDISEAIEEFVTAAKLAFNAGFSGIELHAAHGYLLAQFLSPQSNIRTDEFGGSPAKRAEIVLRIIRRIRAETSKAFTIGIKFNSVDASSSESVDHVLEQIRLINDAGIDFMEISGGTYENTRMLDEPEPEDASLNLNDAKSQNVKQKPSTAQREAFFLSFAETVRTHFPSLVLMVTGGFRTRIGMEAALKSKGCDLVGVGRPAAVLPKLPKEIILNEEVKDEDAGVRLKPLKHSTFLTWLLTIKAFKIVGSGLQGTYYSEQIRRMGKGLKPINSRI